MAAVTAVGGAWRCCGGSQELKCSRNDGDTPIYRLEKKKVSPEIIPATVSESATAWPELMNFPVRVFREKG